MKKSVYVCVALCALFTAGQALAADLPSKSAAPAPAPAYYPPPPVFTWTGFYAGVNGGYGFGKVKSPSFDFGSLNGGQIGGTVGYNYQINQLVFGVEGDLDWVGGNRTNIFTGPVTTKSDLHELNTVRGRIGYAADRALVYVTGGYAGGTLRTSIIDTPNAVSYSSDSYRNGFALGGGIEYAFTNQISAKAEYLYTKLQSETVFGPPDMTTASYSNSLIRVGLNYHF